MGTEPNHCEVYLTIVNTTIHYANVDGVSHGTRMMLWRADAKLYSRLEMDDGDKGVERDPIDLCGLVFGCTTAVEVASSTYTH